MLYCYTFCTTVSVIYRTLFIIIIIYVSLRRERRELQFSCVSVALKRDLMRAHAEIYANGQQPAHYRVHAQMAKKYAAATNARSRP